MRKVRLILLSVFLLALAACERQGADVTLSVGPFGEETRKVLLLYEAGFNSLGRDISDNISTLKKGWLPGDGRDEDVLLVMSHVTKIRKDYVNETSPALIRMYKSYDQVVMDTIQTWSVGTSIANAKMVSEVLSLVRERFPASSYGAVFGSHANGWLPEGYYSTPETYEGNDRSPLWGDFLSAPKRRTFGHEYYDAGKKQEEIEIKDFVAAIPFKLDYILFDACLMGCVEILWALKDVCDYIIAVPTETPSPGFDYETLTEYLLRPEQPDYQAACEDFYARYSPGGDYSYYGACVTLADCRQMDELASVCKTLFERYRTAIRKVDGSKVQSYDESVGSKHYFVFFDLKDMLRQAGATEDELASLQAALDKVVLFEKHTVKTTYSPDLNRCCGLSVYLPAYPDYRRDIYHGTKFLDGFYKDNIAWNQATLLVE